MFQLELFDLLKAYRNAKEEYEVKKIKSSLISLIQQHKQEFEEFVQTQTLDEQTQTLLQQCYEEAMNSQQEQNSQQTNTSAEPQETNQEDDLTTIKKYYQQWLQEYSKNNKNPSQSNIQIITNIINFYAPNRLEVLKKILEIQGDNDYEAFKNMLKNYLRKYFVEKIKNYRESDKFKNLSFFQRLKKKRKIMQVYNELGNYEFNKNHIEEVFQ